MIVLPRGLDLRDVVDPRSLEVGARVRTPADTKKDCLIMGGGETFCRKDLTHPIEGWWIKGDWWVARSNRSSPTSLCTNCKNDMKNERWKHARSTKKSMPWYLALWPQGERVNTHAYRHRTK